jgi:hypothetical protein
MACLLGEVEEALHQVARAHGAEPGRTGAQCGTTWGRPEPHQPEPAGSMDGPSSGIDDRWAHGARREGDPDILAVWEPTGHVPQPVLLPS